MNNIAAAERPLIEFRGVYKAYDNGTKALNDVNLKIYKGEFVFVVGASGAGKSTFIKMIVHEEKPNAGEIVVGNYKMSKLKSRDVPKLRRTMGIVFQDFRLIRDKTVFENVAFAMHVVGASKRDIRKRVAYTLNIVGLGDKARSYPDELSGGEQQRVALARALVNNPAMILADEPTGNVDPNMSYEIVSLLNEINKRGTTVIMVTHEHHLVRDFGHRVIMIEDGTVVADNEIEPIIKNPEDISKKATMFTHDPVESTNIPSPSLSSEAVSVDASVPEETDFDMQEDLKLADKLIKEVQEQPTVEFPSSDFGSVEPSENDNVPIEGLTSDTVDSSTLSGMLFSNDIPDQAQKEGEEQ